jgi:hypothetical protein
MRESDFHRNVCYHYFALYLFPLWCDFLGATPCYSNSFRTGCPIPPSRSLRDDFWSGLLTLGISPADCRLPFGVYLEDKGYCQCSPGYVGTVCRSGNPAHLFYGFIFIVSCMIALFGWIFMVRAREAVSTAIQQRLCPQVRDYSVLIQDLPPNSHLHRSQLCEFLSRRFGPVKFLSFAFDDRKLYDAKEHLRMCRETLERQIITDYDYQSELIKKHVLSQDDAAASVFKIVVDFDTVKNCEIFQFNANEQPGIIRSLLRSLLPHPSIGFVLAPRFIYTWIYGRNAATIRCLEDSSERCFPSVLRIQGSSSSSASDVVAASESSICRVSLFDYMKSFVLGPSPDVLQWQALHAAAAVLQCQQTEFMNSGTAIATFTHASSKELAVRLMGQFACQGRDQKVLLSKR